MQHSRKVLVLVAAMALAAANLSCGNSYTVLIDDFDFTPGGRSGGDQLDAITWENQGDVDHTSTSTIGYWHSGAIAPTGTFTFPMDHAGRHVYICEFHPNRMKGRISVPTTAFPTAGNVGETFTVMWASNFTGTAEVPPGFNADIQIKRNKGKWKTWMQNQTGTDTDAAFVPTKPGTYRFRTRLQNDGTGKSSGFSPRAKINVAPA